jgi:hypothetical protein
LTVKEAEKAQKIELTKIVQILNNRGPIRADQRAGRKRKQAQQEQENEGNEEGKGGLFVDEDRPSEGSSSTAIPRPARRPRLAPPRGGAAAAPRGGNTTRTTRSTRSATGSVIQVQPGSGPSAGAANRGVVRGRGAGNRGKASKRARR